MTTQTLFELTGTNIIDSRDLWERWKDISNELEDADEAIEENADTAAYFAELREELDALDELFEEIEGYSGDKVRDGIQLIADNYFEAYARDTASDLGLPSETGWPMDYIDWVRAADALKQDYTSVDIGTTEYWFR